MTKRAAPEDFEEEPDDLFSRLPSEAESAHRRDEGMEHATIGAENKDAAFSLAALRTVRAVATMRAEFLTEDVREAFGPTEVDGRAWGPVMKQAQRAGIIEPVGFGMARCSNLSPRVLWRSKVYKP